LEIRLLLVLETITVTITTHTLDLTTIGTTDGVMTHFTLHMHMAHTLDMVTTLISMVVITTEDSTTHTATVADTTTITLITDVREGATVEAETQHHPNDTMVHLADLHTVEVLLMGEIQMAIQADRALEEARVRLQDQEVTQKRPTTELLAAVPILPQAEDLADLRDAIQKIE
jgi:hypothetical protein